MSSSRNIRWFSILAILVAGGSGCAPPADRPALGHETQQPPGATPATVEPPGTQPPEMGPSDLTVVRMQFDVTRIDLPVREIKHSLKIWNHVDEAKADPRLTALLARNGFRLGVADRDAQPAIRTIFEENEARIGQVRHSATDGLPLMLSLGSVQEGSTYFVHRKDGGLIGETFNAGTMFLRIDYVMTDDKPPRVVLQVTPELREDRTRTRLVDRGGEIQAIQVHDGTVFDELSTMFTLKRTQFLVIGTSERAQKGYILGSWWLTSVLNMQQYETVLCVTPLPFGVRPAARPGHTGGP